MHALGFVKTRMLPWTMALVLCSCGGDDDRGDTGSSSPTSSDDSTTGGTSVGPGDASQSATTQSSATSDGETSASTLDSSEDGEPTGGETTNDPTDTGEICACTDDLPGCDEDFAPGGECGRSSNERCCHVDGPYTCICPFAPPCEWTKDECS